MPAKSHGAQTEIRGEDIGHGVHVRFYTSVNPDTKQAERAGIIVAHRHPDGAVCEGGVSFDCPATRAHHKSGRPLWQVQSLEPLTISPSILDKECGLHGHIVAGKWVPC